MSKDLLRRHCWRSRLISVCEILPKVTIVACGCLAILFAGLLHSLPGWLSTLVALLGVPLGLILVREAASSWLRLRDRLADKLNLLEVNYDQLGCFLLLHSFTRPDDQIFQYQEKPTAHGVTYGPLPYFDQNAHNKGADNRIHDHLLWSIDAAVLGLGRLVRLGGPTIHKRSTTSIRLAVEDWKPVMERAARLCRLIIFVPELSRSLLEELASLRDSGLYAKTVVVMQPEREFGDEGVKRAEAWESYRQVLADSGFNFPTYNPAGMLYLPAPDFSIGHLLKMSLRDDFVEEFREGVTSALRQARTYVPCCEAFPIILGQQPEERALFRVDADGCGQQRKASGPFNSLLKLYTNPSGFLEDMRNSAHGRWTYLLLSLITIGILSFCLYIACGDILRRSWAYALPVLKLDAGVLCCASIVMVIAFAVGGHYGTGIGYLAFFFGVCIFSFVSVVGFVAQLPSEREGIIIGAGAGLFMGGLIAWLSSFRGLRFIINVRILLMLVVTIAGPIALLKQAYDSGLHSTFPGLAFGCGLLCGLYRLYNLLVHALLSFLPTRFWLLRTHPACWDRVCVLPYWGLEYLLAKFAMKDQSAGLRLIRQVGEHAPLRPAAARAEQAVYVVAAKMASYTATTGEAQETRSLS